MATLSTKLTVTSSDARTDAINISLSDTLTITDPVETGKIPITTSAGGGLLGTLVPASDSNTYYVYIKNLDTITIADPIETGKRNVTKAVAGGGEFVAAADSNTYYVYLKNIDDTNFVYVQDAAAATFGKLFPGEFMWFTLAPSEGMELRADTDTVKVEYGLFKKG